MAEYQPVVATSNLETTSYEEQSMSFTTSALGAIQKTGASAHRAAMALQDAKKKAAADLAKAITSSADQNAEISPDQLNADARRQNRGDIISSD